MTPTLEQLRTTLDGHDEVLIAFVFGSAVSGTQGPESDLDIGVAGRAPLRASARLESDLLEKPGQSES